MSRLVRFSLSYRFSSNLQFVNASPWLAVAVVVVIVSIILIGEEIGDCGDVVVADDDKQQQCAIITTMFTITDNIRPVIMVICINVRNFGCVSSHASTSSVASAWLPWFMLVLLIFGLPCARMQFRRRKAKFYAWKLPL